MNTSNEVRHSAAADERPAVLHCLDSYLRTTENWIFRLIKHQKRSRRYVATTRFLECNFALPDVKFLRSPLQPSLDEMSHPTRLRRWMRAINEITYSWYLRAALRDQEIAIVHSHFAQVGWQYRKIAQALHAVHVVSFYGWDYVRMATLDPTWLPRLKQLYASTDCFVCEGPHGAELLAKNGCPKEKIRIAKLGVEPNEISFLPRRKRAGSLRLLQMASFREKKGHLDTVNAFAEALERWPEMHLTLVGAAPGDVYDAIIRVVQSRGIADRVSLLPGVSFDELHATMHEHHVFIHPSRHAKDGDCEGGAPVVLLDAQATGMPVISTTHCDIPEEVANGVTGILCAEGDTRSLVEAIGQFCEMDEDRYLEYANAARAHVEANFDARDCAVAMESLYRELAGNRHAR